MGRKEAPRRVAVIGGGAGGLCAAIAAGQAVRCAALFLWLARALDGRG